MSTPTSVLERLRQQRVELRLKDGRSVAGVLQGFDEHLNLVLDDAEVRSEDLLRRVGRAVVRGSNVLAVSAPEGVPARAQGP